MPAYSLPANRQQVVIQRILVRQGVSRDLASLLIDNLKDAMAYFQRRPVQSPMTGEEATGFHH